MKNFIPLGDGTLLNVNAIAYIQPITIPGSRIKAELRVVMMPLGEDQAPDLFQASFGGAVAENFLNALAKAGINVTDLRRHLKSPRSAIAKALYEVASQPGGKRRKTGAFGAIERVGRGEKG